jgi:DNA-directed RNA polymerase subunit M/transcription elongation factor TFIIS
MPILSTVVLTIKGEPRKTNITLQDNELTIDILHKYFKKKNAPECVCKYENNGNYIHIIGYTTGKPVTVNKTVLPPPNTDVVLYGDAVVIVSTSDNWNTPIAFTVNQWTMVCESITNTDNVEKNEKKKNEKNEKNEKNDVIENDDDDVNDNEEEDEEEEEEEDAEEEGVNEEDIENLEQNNEEEPEEEIEEKPAPVKRRRAPAYSKTVIASVKEDIILDSTPDANKMRIRCINNLQFLESKFTKEQITLLEKAIFEAAFKYAVKLHVVRSWDNPVFIEVYRQIVRSVFSNIHPDSPVKNQRLLSRVLDGEFQLHEIPSMTAYDMFPEKWFTLRDKQLQREQKILEGNKSRATDQFKCRRCGKRECTYYELQTRSADEPMTIFVTCLNCGKEWRNGG